MIIDQPRIESRIRGPGGKAVCVRLCDGYNFPLDLKGDAARDEGDEACRSLCPAAETKLFFTPREIEDARSADGEAYTDLDNAFRYRKTYDAACSCGRPGDARTGALVLNPAEGGAGGGFDIVNPGREDEDAPLRGLTSIPGRNQNAPLFKTEPRPAPSPPPEIQVENLIPSDQGEVREIRGADGVTRRVRVIATTPSRAPATAAEPSSQGRAPAP